MTSPMSAEAVLDREFLQMRARILELAACFDRLGRSDGDVEQDARFSQLLRGIEMLLSSDRERAEQVQLLFSREYEEQWREDYELSRTTARNSNPSR